MVLGIMLLVKDQATEKKIKLINKISPNDKVYIDEIMIDTVIRNLITNAIKFTPSGGEVTIGCEFNNVNGYSGYYVKDNGVGIDEAKIEDLFRVDKTKSTKGTEDEGGTGLGLILCKEFIEKNKGIIRVESQLNIGTTIYFSLLSTDKLL